MDAVTRCTVQHARDVAREIGAQAVLIFADAIAAREELFKSGQLVADIHRPGNDGRLPI